MDRKQFIWGQQQASIYRSSIVATSELELISHHLCPYRAVITLLEKDIPHRRTYIGLSNKPDWFRQISPLGKVPLLKVGNEVLFESAVLSHHRWHLV